MALICEAACPRCQGCLAVNDNRRKISDLRAQIHPNRRTFNRHLLKLTKETGSGFELRGSAVRRLSLPGRIRSGMVLLMLTRRQHFRSGKSLQCHLVACWHLLPCQDHRGDGLPFHYIPSHKQRPIRKRKMMRTN